ncbi:MAG: MFS transporter [Chloroflexi bacterium]|nr:MFS transporter [Chloroflexota bacterium]
MADHAPSDGLAVASTPTQPQPPHNLGHGFRALHNPNYRNYWIGQVISITGSWMQTTAQAWLVLQITGSALSLGTVAALQFLPVTLLALYGGVIADRLRKHHALVFTQFALMIQAFIFGLLVALDVIQLWHIYLLAAAQGLVSALDTPVRQAFVVEMVGRDDLPNAIALNSMVFNTARILGPSMAGIIIDQIGIAPALWLNAVSFLAVLIALLRMNTALLHAARPATNGSATKRLIEGVSYAWHTPAILSILICVGAIGTFGFNYSVMLPLLARFILKTDATGFGTLGSFVGIGSLLAALVTAYLTQITMRRLLLGAGAFSLCFALVALSQVYFVTAIFLVGMGFAGVTFAASSNTLLQLLAPDEMRGRIMSLHVLLFMGTTPIGGFFIGALSDVVGVSITLLICAALCLAGTLAAIFYYRQPHPVPQTDTTPA